MRAVFIDPRAASVEERDVADTLRAMQSVVGGPIQYVPTEGYVPLPPGDWLYVDEDARLKHHEYEDLWHLRGWWEDYLVGPGLIMGVSRGGANAPAAVSVEAVRRLVTFRPVLAA